jgi:hypothetical protein
MEVVVVVVVVAVGGGSGGSGGWWWWWWVVVVVLGGSGGGGGGRECHRRTLLADGRRCDIAQLFVGGGSVGFTCHQVLSSPPHAHPHPHTTPPPPRVCGFTKYQFLQMPY